VVLVPVGVGGNDEFYGGTGHDGMIGGRDSNYFDSGLDGNATNFHEAFGKEFFTLNNARTRHISHIRLQGDQNNSNMER
jgi:hypothetical protein